MTNREKYAKEILDIVCEGDMVALKNGNLCACNSIPCMECDICFSFDLNDTTDCRGRFKKWSESECSEKPKISESDRRFLDYIPDAYKWMARDLDGKLYIYKIFKPKKCAGNVWDNETNEIIRLSETFIVRFPMVKWEDEEPWLIENLKKLEVE